jgi:hypothetical protein
MSQDEKDAAKLTRRVACAARSQGQKDAPMPQGEKDAQKESKFKLAWNTKYAAMSQEQKDARKQKRKLQARSSCKRKVGLLKAT